MKAFFKIYILILYTFFIGGTLKVQAQMDNAYTLIIQGYDWGPGANKVVIPMHMQLDKVNSEEFAVSVKRSATGVRLKKREESGNRKIVYAYVSNAEGKVDSAGEYVTLVLDVNPNDPLSSPIKYMTQMRPGSNKWINYYLNIKHIPTNRNWNSEAKRILPGVDKFDLSGTYSQAGINLSYASFAPDKKETKSPLLIWLHGGGEGGTDPSIPLIANKATNYASDEIQEIFDGAYVLVPQSPTFWMQNSEGKYTRGKENDIYNAALFGLIKNYVAKNPNIDTSRIYVGGCSNGGYMSLKLIIEHPNYFAAAYISALAFLDEYITEKQLHSIKNTPIWFVHSKDDTTTLPNETVVPLYKRLISAGANNVHFSFYEHVIDLSGFYGGKDHHYSGHWSWIYSHINDADFDFDGKPVTIANRPVHIMEWMAHQKNN